MFTIKLPITNNVKIVPIIWDSKPILRKFKIPMIKLIIMVTRIFAKTKNQYSFLFATPPN